MRGKLNYSTTSRRNPSQGTTILELLVALVVMGLIAVLISNALSFNRRSLNTAQRFSQVTDQLLSRNTLRGWIEDMPLKFGGEDAAYFFSGSISQLTFRTLVRDGSFWIGELATISLSLETGDDGQILRAIGLGQSLESQSNTTTTILLEPNANSLVISYFGKKTGEPTSKWHDSWVDKKGLPLLVKIEWMRQGSAVPPLTLEPGRIASQRLMSLSSLVPPARPSRP